MIKTEDLVEVRGVGSQKDESRITHPAFAQIGASRVSGHTNLYGSEFEHQHYVTITISKSELGRSLSRDWPFAREELIEVSLSEAQWATFVSTMNHGSGVQCTLNHVQGKQVPGIPHQKPQSERFAEEMKQAVASVKNDIKVLAEGLDGPLAKSKVAELKKELVWISERIEGHATFVANQFDEHMEATTEKAKIEVNAYITNAVQRAGLDAILEKGMLALPGAK
jgi:hypothetical protein